MSGRDGTGGAEAEAILALLARRPEGRTICPSEAARALGPGDWRARMDAVRGAAYALADAGRLEVTQGGEPVDGRTARGVIRLRLPPRRTI